MPALPVGQHHQPADVEQPAADRRQLPVDDAAQAAAVVEHVAGLVVAVDEPDRRVRRQGREQPLARAQAGLDPWRLGRLGEDRAPALDLVAQRARRLPVEQMALPVEAVQAGERIDALLPQRRHRRRREVEGGVRLPDEERPPGQELHHHERRAEGVLVGTGPGHVGYRQAGAMQRAQQRGLPIDVGVAGAAHTRWRQLEDELSACRGGGSVDDAKAEGQAGMSGLHHLQRLDRAVRPVVRVDEPVQVGGHRIDVHRRHCGLDRRTASRRRDEGNCLPSNRHAAPAASMPCPISC